MRKLHVLDCSCQDSSSKSTSILSQHLWAGDLHPFVHVGAGVNMLTDWT